MIALATAFTLIAAASEPARAELCLAHINTMIAEEANATGRVAGPSWFIRDWWSARLPEEGSAEALSTEQRTQLELSMPERKAADPDAYRAELQSCVREAIDGGALP
ncbi:hypothetical protein GGQ87_000540 [Brevundimonas alba]|uniref:Uncharacterized protein n=1 Tax=Brevundimonas alba TaxID=74314 RepID=A0A7X6BMF4_9CAUL|nr:hypothetical protein [Brevundimonas alba]NJC40282.1 hypothetical protein [Brevundimonas alba]